MEESYFEIQKLEQFLKGTLNSNSQKEIIIDWEWAYELGENEGMILKNDKIDTYDGQNLENYQFKIIVIGKEVE